MKRGQKTGAEQVVKLRQIEVQPARGKSLAIACREAEISEQRYYILGVIEALADAMCLHGSPNTSAAITGRR